MKGEETEGIVRWLLKIELQVIETNQGIGNRKRKETIDSINILNRQDRTWRVY